MPRDELSIDTVYNGYRFRSRLEARWAVFFDCCNIQYFYEIQGYECHGKNFLPDFWIPTQGSLVGNAGIYLEVKPVMEPDAYAACAYMNALVGKETHLYVGSPYPREFYSIFWEENEDGVWVANKEEGHITSNTSLWACKQAMAARFEFGETPVPAKLRDGISIRGENRPKNNIS